MCVCVCASARTREYVRESVCVVRIFGVCVSVLRVCEFLCVCIGKTSPLSSVRLLVQSSPGGAHSHFLRWLTAVLVNNNTK